MRNDGIKGDAAQGRESKKGTDGRNSNWMPMNKRQFLKKSGLLISGSMLARFKVSAQEADPRTNWAGNYTFRASRLDSPKTIGEVRDLVRREAKLKVLGERHSFNGIADCADDQISLKDLNQMVVHSRAQTVTVGAGVTYSQLAPYLDAHGFALHNLASLPHISVGGACATATHGSGNKNGNLSTAVAAMEIVTGEGRMAIVSKNEDKERFQGAVVSLGGLGVVTRITLDVQPTFQMRQVVYKNLSMDRLEKHLDEIFASGYSVSLFTDWQSHRMTQVWVKSKVVPGTTYKARTDFFGAKPAIQNLHPVTGHSAESCTEQMGVPGPWYERLPHFRINSIPSSGQELQSEYFVPRDRGYEAILAVEQLRDLVTPHLFVTEMRTIDADNLWMSPCYHRPSMTIHFTWKPEWAAVKQILPRIEEKLAPFNARPHWAKLFTMPPSRLKELYVKLPDFQALLEKYDPHGKFRNQYLNANIFGA
jgi:alditol oxidase